MGLCVSVMQVIMGTVYGCPSVKSAVGVTNSFLIGFKMSLTEGTDVWHYKPRPTVTAGEATDRVLLNGYDVPVKWSSE